MLFMKLIKKILYYLKYLVIYVYMGIIIVYFLDTYLKKLEKSQK